jgi:hypothetical protein
VAAYAKSAGYENVKEFYDAACPAPTRLTSGRVSRRCCSVFLATAFRTIIVETASRFARDLIVQEPGRRFRRDSGVTLSAADSPDSLPRRDADRRSHPPSPRGGHAIREAGPCRQVAEGSRAKEGRDGQVRRAQKRRRGFAGNGRTRQEPGALSRQRAKALIAGCGGRTGSGRTCDEKGHALRRRARRPYDRLRKAAGGHCRASSCLEIE